MTMSWWTTSCRCKEICRDDLDPLYREAELLDFDGRFEEVIQQKVKGLRTDKTLWVSKKLFEDAFSGNHEKPLHLSLSYCPKIRDILNLFYSFPFELNKKTILGLQASEFLQATQRQRVRGGRHRPQSHLHLNAP